MENEKAFNWQTPTAKTWGGSRSKSALVTIHAKPFRSGKNKTYSPYFRLHVNKLFLEKYYKGKTEGFISIAIGGKGVLFDVRPSKNQPTFKFNKQRTISDKSLVENILAHFKTPISMTEVTSLKLHTKPFGEHEGRPIYQLCMISDQNEETPHFYEPQSITIEG
jgi:hypothetical protein